MGTDIANFYSPTSSNLTLDRKVPLLSIRSVGLHGRSRERRQIDRAIRGRSSIIQTRLSRIVYENWSDKRIVNVQRTRAANTS